MSLEIRILLNDDQEDKFNDIAKASIGNKTFVKGELIEYALNRFHKKLCKPAKIIETLGSAENE